MEVAVAADLFALAFFAAWSSVLVSAVCRVDARLRAGAEFRAAALLLDARRNG